MIIGVMGQAGSGKDTFANHLVLKKRYSIIALADPMKRFLMQVYGFSVEQLWGPSHLRNIGDKRYPTKDGFLTPRKALQTLGTEWARANYEDTWVDLALRTSHEVILGARYTQYEGILSPSLLTKGMDTFDTLFGKEKIGGVVIPDVRFKNEVAKILDANGIVIRLKAPWAAEAAKEAASAGVANHSSEEEQKTVSDSDVSHVFEVPKGLPNYYAAIDSFMESKRL